MLRFYISFVIMLTVHMASLADDVALPGTPLNNCEKAFDDDANTYYAASTPNYAWAGIDLGERHVITRVGWMPRDNVSSRMLLGVFEGANSPDFMDALPLAIIRSVNEVGKPGEMSYSDVTCSQGFRYVRYVGPSSSFCHVAELKFYGHKGMGDLSNLYRITNIPTVSIHTANGDPPCDKVHEIEARFTIIGDSTNALLSETGTIRERGNASRDFPKKPWRISFDSKQHVLDAPAYAKKWTLINNYGDKTLMRNLLAFELSRLMGMPYTPYGRAVDVLLNGEYKGCYQLCDHIQVHKQRVDIEEMTPRDNSGIALTGGYFFEIDAYADGEKSYFYSTNYTPVTIKSPDEDSITTSQKNYIKSHFNKMESNWSRYLDLSTFLRHFLVGELSGNTDTYWSLFMYKHRQNDTIYTGPVWDFDLAFDNDQRTYPVNNKRDYIYRSGGSYAGDMKNFVDKIVVKTASTRERLLDIWDEARHDGINEEYLIAFIDSLEEELLLSQELNFLRWPIMNRYVHQNPKIWGSYAAEVDNVRYFIRKRLEWMDNKLGYTYEPEIISTITVPDEIDFSRPYTVFTIGGQSCGNDIEVLPAGFYIIRQDNLVKKIRVE